MWYTRSDSFLRCSELYTPLRNEKWVTIYDRLRCEAKIKKSIRERSIPYENIVRYWKWV